jgi:hypothetical protein
MKTIRNIVACASLAWLMLPTSTAAAADLRDGTIVQVRLVSPITSENAKPGDSVPLVVTRDVIVDGAVVIARKTPATGLIVLARRASWGFINHRPLLSFAFVQTTAVDGQPIRLHATTGFGQVDINRGDYNHNLQWATEGDVFQAAVGGDYELDVR